MVPVTSSATVMVSGPPVSVGASLSFLTVTSTLSVPVELSSAVTLIVTSYSLFLPESAGVSKLGGALNASEALVPLAVRSKRLRSEPSRVHVNVVLAPSGSDTV